MVHAITGADKPGKEAQAESVQWEVRAADFPNYPPTSVLMCCLCLSLQGRDQVCNIHISRRAFRTAEV